MKQDDNVISHESGNKDISLSSDSNIVELDIFDDENQKTLTLNLIVKEQNVDGSWSKN